MRVLLWMNYIFLVGYTYERCITPVYSGTCGEILTEYCKSVCDHQGIARMHLALLLSYAIILCNLGSVATGPRSKKRGKSDIHQEGAGLFDPRSVHYHINIHF